MGGHIGNVLTLINNFAGTGRYPPGHNVDKGGFAGTVGTDDGSEPIFFYIDANTVRGQHATEMTAQIFGTQKCFHFSVIIPFAAA